MKQKLFNLSLIFLGVIASLSGCKPSDAKYTLTFGTYVQETAQKLQYPDLASKILDEESMIVVTYDKDDSTCGCWRSFSYAIDAVMKEYHYLIYKISIFSFSEGDDRFGLAMYDDRPSINFIKEGKVIEKISYNPRNVDPLFKGKEALHQAIEKRCYLPNYYLYDAFSIDEKIASDEEFIVCYYWTSCGDCKFSFPTVLYPYSQSKKFSIPMYMVNLEVEGVLLNDGVSDKTNHNYISYLKNHYISEESGSIYGYGRGFVPTFHYYNNGLKDASVFFNDTIILNEDNQYVVSSSFYSQKRQEFLHYTKNVKNPVLEGIILSENDIDVYHFENGDIYAWKQTSAINYHQPLLEAFLNQYAI